MMCCERNEHEELLKSYDPRPKNSDGSVRRYLYRWDDGKDGSRRLVKCRACGALYLVQAYHLHKFSRLRDILFEDWYQVSSEEEADRWNESFTGMQLEHAKTPAFRRERLSSD